MPEPREKFVYSLGLPIHYLEWGEPDGELILLIHGYLDLAHSWRALVAALEKRLNRMRWIIAPDCRAISLPPLNTIVVGIPRMLKPDAVRDE